MRQPLGAPINREFFARPTIAVAPELLGSLFIVDAGGGDEVRARIVEVEAYLGLDDPASHAYRGPTKRSAIMFGAPGHLYVYLSYGVHHCANLICEPAGTAGAVLIRSAAVEVGEDIVRWRREEGGRRSAVPSDALLRGPGNLCRGLGLSLTDNGLDVCSATSRVRLIGARQDGAVVTARRIGISRAQEVALRFCIRGDAAVSLPRP